MPEPTIDSPKLLAAVKLLERTGAQTYRTGYSDEEDGAPTVWYAVAQWPGNKAEAAASLDPVQATLRLCELVIDGGTCTHCGQVTIFDPDPPGDDVLTEMLDRMGCRYAWDPELSTFRRSCEGDDA
jgi:hypothetical protein